MMEADFGLMPKRLGSRENMSMAPHPASDVFELVAARVESRRDSLRDFLSWFYGPNVPKTAGLEGWFTVQAILVLGDRVKTMNLNKGPDLVLRDDNSTVMLELKGAADLNPSYLRDGATKYCVPKYPTFAGCLFLGDGSDDSRIKKLSEGDVQLLERRTFQDGERTWIVGLLTSTTRRGRGAQAFKPPKAVT